VEEAGSASVKGFQLLGASELLMSEEAGGVAATGGAAGGAGGQRAASANTARDEDAARTSPVAGGSFGRRTPSPRDDGLVANAPRSVEEWLVALGMNGKRLAPLLQSAGAVRVQAIPGLTEAALVEAGVSNDKERTKILAGVRAMAARSARLTGARGGRGGDASSGGRGAGGKSAAERGRMPPQDPASSKSAQTAAADEDYFKATRLHHDRDGWWADDGSTGGAPPQAQVQGTKGIPTPLGLGLGETPRDAAASGAGKQFDGPRRNTRADHARKAHNQRQRAAKKQAG